MPNQNPAQSAQAAQPETDPPEFATAQIFFDRFLREIMSRRYQYGAVHWCRHWHLHPEARLVVTELHTIYEHLRSMREEAPHWRAQWLRDWCYPLMNQLFNPSGTFSECTKDTGHISDFGVLGSDMR